MPLLERLKHWLLPETLDQPSHAATTISARTTVRGKSAGARFPRPMHACLLRKTHCECHE